VSPTAIKGDRREENIPRLSAAETGPWDQYYLVHRNLFSTLEQVTTYARGRLLDIGCGNKPYENLFLKRVQEYVGCDIVQSSLKKVDLLCPSGQIPLPDASFDTVLSTQTIEHVGDPQALMAEAHRLLKSSGHFLISGPMYWHLHEEPHDYYRFTKYGFDFMLSRQGFEVVEIRANGGKWAMLGLVMLHTLPRNKKGLPIFMSWINRLFAYLDDRYHDEINTSTYLAVARKK
jgi:SAM-dependent methyltransferase